MHREMLSENLRAKLVGNTLKFSQAYGRSTDLNGYNILLSRLKYTNVFTLAWGTYNVLVLPASFPYGGKFHPECDIHVLLLLLINLNLALSVQ